MFEIISIVGVVLGIWCSVLYLSEKHRHFVRKVLMRCSFKRCKKCGTKLVLNTNDELYCIKC